MRSGGRGPASAAARLSASCSGRLAPTIGAVTAAAASGRSPCACRPSGSGIAIPQPAARRRSMRPCRRCIGRSVVARKTTLGSSMLTNSPRMRATPGFRAKVLFRRSSIENHRWKASNFVIKARHFTCQFGCAAQNAAPEPVLTKAFSRNGHQQGLPLAISRFCALKENFAKGAASISRRAMVLNCQTREKPPGRVAAALSFGALTFRALPARVEPCERKGIVQIQRVGACRNRKSRTAFSGYALIHAWSFP